MFANKDLGFWIFGHIAAFTKGNFCWYHAATFLLYTIIPSEALRITYLAIAFIPCTLSAMKTLSEVVIINLYLCTCNAFINTHCSVMGANSWLNITCGDMRRIIRFIPNRSECAPALIPLRRNMTSISGFNLFNSSWWSYVNPTQSTFQNTMVKSYILAISLNTSIFHGGKYWKKYIAFSLFISTTHGLFKSN